MGIHLLNHPYLSDSSKFVSNFLDADVCVVIVLLCGIVHVDMGGMGGIWRCDGSSWEKFLCVVLCESQWG